MNILFIIMFFGYSMYFMKNMFYVLMFSILMILIRGSLPRLRYDNLMYFCWYYILSISMMMLLLVVYLKYFFWFNF